MRPLRCRRWLLLLLLLCVLLAGHVAADDLDEELDEFAGDDGADPDDEGVDPDDEGMEVGDAADDEEEEADEVEEFEIASPKELQGYWWEFLKQQLTKTKGKVGGFQPGDDMHQQVTCVRLRHPQRAVVLTALCRPRRRLTSVN